MGHFYFKYVCPKSKNSSNILEQFQQYQYHIQEEIKSRLKSGNASYQLLQNRLSPSLLSKNIKIHGTIILLVILHGFETWSLTLREDVG